MNLVVSPKRVTQILTFIVLFLTLENLAALFLFDYLSYPWLMSVQKVFDVTFERNIPTWYASSTLLLSAFILAIIAFAKKKEGARFVLHWTAMSFIFLYLSFDEAFEVHEGWIIPLRTYFGAGGFFHFAWVIPAIAFVLIFVLAYLRFLIDLPVSTRRLFLIAGALFVGGALGLEMFQGYYLLNYGMYNTPFLIITTVEEFLEMLGIVVFIHALMSYMSSENVRIRFDDKVLAPLERS